MKHFLAVLMPAAGLAVLTGCGLVGGTVTTTVPAHGFTAVSTSAGISVEIASSSDWAVALIADRLAVGRIIVEVRGSTLWVGLRAGTFARARWLASQARVAIAMPALDRLDAADGSTARLGVQQPDRDLVVSLTAGSNLAGSLSCAALTLYARGASVADIRGIARSVKLEASDGTRLRLSGFETPSMDASISGGSTAAVAVSQRLIVVAAGGSGLSFRGDARVESQTLSGGSWLRKE
jgi:hypothetical protein